MLYVFAAFGFALLVTGILARRFSNRAFRSGSVPAEWRRWRRVALVAGIVFVISVPWHQYPYQRGTVLGFPFFAAWYDERGRDFIGAMTLPALLGDAVVWFLIPQVILAFAVRRHLRSHAHSHTHAP